MIDERSSGGSGLPPGVIFRNPDRYLPAAGPTNYRLVEIQLRKALAKSQALLLQKDELILRQELLKEESDHRLLNDLQMTISLLSLQSRNSANPEAAAQLAARRVLLRTRGQLVKSLDQPFKISNALLNVSPNTTVAFVA
jgi:hypothetical protein